MEPLNKGHFRASHVVLCRGVVLFLEVQNALVPWERYLEECPLQRGRPFLKGRFHCISGGTVVIKSLVSCTLPFFLLSDQSAFAVTSSTTKLIGQITRLTVLKLTRYLQSITQEKIIPNKR